MRASVIKFDQFDQHCMVPFTSPFNFISIIHFLYELLTFQIPQNVQYKFALLSAYILPKMTFQLRVYSRADQEHIRHYSIVLHRQQSGSVTRKVNPSDRLQCTVDSSVCVHFTGLLCSHAEWRHISLRLLEFCYFYYYFLKSDAIFHFDSNSLLYSVQRPISVLQNTMWHFRDKAIFISFRNCFSSEIQSFYFVLSFFFCSGNFMLKKGGGGVSSFSQLSIQESCVWEEAFRSRKYHFQTA